MLLLLRHPQRRHIKLDSGDTMRTRGTRHGDAVTARRRATMISNNPRSAQLTTPLRMMMLMSLLLENLALAFTKRLTPPYIKNRTPSPMMMSRGGDVRAICMCVVVGLLVRCGGSCLRRDTVLREVCFTTRSLRRPTRISRESEMPAPVRIFVPLSYVTAGGRHTRSRRTCRRSAPPCRGSSSRAGTTAGSGRRQCPPRA